MKPLYTKKDYDSVKSTQILPLKCYHCEKTFYKLKKYITSEIKLQKGELKFCSHECSHNSKNKKQFVICTNCGVKFEKQLCQIKTNNYCSNSCNASYTNKHKSTGTRRSKLEIWLEEQLTNLYPNLDIHYNKTSTIGSELDIYIPSLNLAFELNGIFHYEPIYGVNKLQKIQENDNSKSKACHEAKIDLCIIDTSGQKYVKPSTSQKYLDIIINIINERLLTS
jgi:hypothetical protein